jgi:hypothetical protein
VRFALTFGQLIRGVGIYCGDESMLPLIAILEGCVSCGTRENHIDSIIQLERAYGKHQSVAHVEDDLGLRGVGAKTVRKGRRELRRDLRQKERHTANSDQTINLFVLSVP